MPTYDDQGNRIRTGERVRNPIAGRSEGGWILAVMVAIALLFGIAVCYRDAVRRERAEYSDVRADDLQAAKAALTSPAPSLLRCDWNFGMEPRQRRHRFSSSRQKEERHG